MSDLHTAVADYLAMRRSLGFALDRAGRLLPHFVDYLETTTGQSTVTIAAAVDWAMLPAQASKAWQADRLSIVRGFARYLHGLDACHQVPPTDLLVGRRQRRAPYLYSQQDIAAMMDQAGQLIPTWRAACYQTLIGLLATSGMRLGEALGLDCQDVDLDQGWVLIRHGKNGRSRKVALHQTTVVALQDYLRVRQQQWPQPVTSALFVSMRGARLGAGTVHDTFRAIIDGVGLTKAANNSRRPVPHQLRHTFAVRTLIGWYRNAADVGAMLPVLSTWLGHVEPTDTYWYLQASPELLALAAQRLEHRTETQS